MRCLSAFSGCGWAYGLTLTPLPPQMLPQIWKRLLKSYQMQVCKPCHYALIETVEPFKLHPISLSYIYEIFEHLLRLWMGIWLQIHILTTTDTSPDLWELAEILPNASLQTMPLGCGWGCTTFQNAFHDHVLHIWGVWAPFQVVGGHMASHSHHCHHRCLPRFGEVGSNPALCKYANSIRLFCSAGSLFCYLFCEVWLFLPGRTHERII